MTAFTDDDLVRLKAEMVINKGEGSTLPDELLRFIARLEAAEIIVQRFIEDGARYFHPVDPLYAFHRKEGRCHSCENNDMSEAWKKTAGRL